MQPTADQVATLAAYLNHDQDECVDALVADYGLDRAEAKEKVASAFRARQELDIEDAHDEMEDEANA